MRLHQVCCARLRSQRVPLAHVAKQACLTKSMSQTQEESPETTDQADSGDSGADGGDEGGGDSEEGGDEEEEHKPEVHVSMVNLIYIISSKNREALARQPRATTASFTAAGAPLTCSLLVCR